jgi:hypothetical protein
MEARVGIQSTIQLFVGYRNWLLIALQDTRFCTRLMDRIQSDISGVETAGALLRSDVP